MAIIVKKLLYRIAQALGLMLALQTILIAIMLYGTHKAESDAKEFCQATPIGQSVDEITTRINHSSALKEQSQPFSPTGNGPAEIYTVVFQGYAYDHHFCEITLKNNRATARKASHP